MKPRTRKAVFTQTCSAAWDGDSFGNEWRCGASVYPSPDSSGYEIYEDDGRGNGDFLSSSATLDEAKRVVKEHCAKLDNWLAKMPVGRGVR